MTSCLATCRVTGTTYPHHRVSKPDSDTAQCGRQKAVLSLFLSWDCRSRYVNRAPMVPRAFFTGVRKKNPYLFIFIGSVSRVCWLAVHSGQAASGFERLRNYESSGAVRLIRVTRDANEEKTGIGVNARPMVFPMKLNDRVCGRPF